MGYALRATQAQVVSWGNSNFYSDLLARCRPMRAEIIETAPDIETTGLNSTRADRLPDLKQWAFDIETLALATPITGSIGIVELTSGTSAYLQFADAFTITLRTTAVHPMTALRTTTGGTIPEWESWMPDYSEWFGSITTYADSATALKLAHSYKTDFASSDTRPTAKFTYGNGGTPESLTGKIQVTGTTLRAARGDKQVFTVTFKGVGALTPAGTGSPLGSTAFGVPIWSEGGTAAGPIVFASLPSTRTLTGEDSFWEEITINAALRQAMMLQIKGRGVGSLTPG